VGVGGLGFRVSVWGSWVSASGFPGFWVSAALSLPLRHRQLGRVALSIPPSPVRGTSSLSVLWCLLSLSSDWPVYAAHSYFLFSDWPVHAAHSYRPPANTHSLSPTESCLFPLASQLLVN
jgi:hypothetical protein